MGGAVGKGAFEAMFLFVRSTTSASFIHWHNPIIVLLKEVFVQGKKLRALNLLNDSTSSFVHASNCIGSFEVCMNPWLSTKVLMRNS
mmetsp:Transcript_5875/g.8295  ORF Transcript_5875/g.8295 Transcript_5875/m.8295 type:complete len:87 (+) Transcript_5875:695-955(+)